MLTWNATSADAFRDLLEEWERAATPEWRAAVKELKVAMRAELAPS